VQPRLRLIIMRHGEAAEGPRSGSDHARTLTPRGIDQARSIGRKLVEREWVPQLAIASDSARTRETAAAVGDELGAHLPWRFEGKLYLSGLEAIRGALEALDAGRAPTVLVLGHNPGFSAAVQELTGEDVSLGTADAALLATEAASWAEAMAGGMWTLEALLRP
jgi:phosphohistidine phosphatase